MALILPQGVTRTQTPKERIALRRAKANEKRKAAGLPTFEERAERKEQVKDILTLRAIGRRPEEKQGELLARASANPRRAGRPQLRPEHLQQLQGGGLPAFNPQTQQSPFRMLDPGTPDGRGAVVEFSGQGRMPEVPFGTTVMSNGEARIHFGKQSLPVTFGLNSKGQRIPEIDARQVALDDITSNPEVRDHVISTFAGSDNPLFAKMGQAFNSDVATVHDRVAQGEMTQEQADEIVNERSNELAGQMLAAARLPRALRDLDQKEEEPTTGVMNPDDAKAALENAFEYPEGSGQMVTMSRDANGNVKVTPLPNDMAFQKHKMNIAGNKQREANAVRDLRLDTVDQVMKEHLAASKTLENPGGTPMDLEEAFKKADERIAMAISKEDKLRRMSTDRFEFDGRETGVIDGTRVFLDTFEDVPTPIAAKR